MQKVKVVCLILATVLASVGTVVVVQNMGDTAAPPVLPQDSENTFLAKPLEGTPSLYDAKENLYIAAGELHRKGGFVGVSYGTTTSAGISQEVSNKRTVVGGNVFKQMSTCSSLVKNAYQVYLYGEDYLFRKANDIKDINTITWDNSAVNYGKDGFLGKFGHRSDGLTGYILNDETVLDGKFVGEENGIFTYRYSLDIEKAPAYMLYEMRANSNMDGFSTFVRAEIIVTMDADWQVKTLTTDCEYKVPLFGGIKCKEDITETFSDIGYNGDLPEKEFFEQYLNAEIEQPVVEEPDALSILMKVLEPYIAGDKLNVSLTAMQGDTKLVDGLVSAKIDIENIENIALDVKLGSDLYLKYGAGKLFVTYQDFKGSTTVNGIMDLVGALLPGTQNVDVGETGDTDSDFVSNLLSKFSFKIEDDICTVNLPVELGEMSLEANIYAKVVDGKYEFIRAEAVIGDIRLDLKPVASWSAPETEGNYPEILGLLDIIKDGSLNLNVKVGDISANVMFDILSKSLFAQCGDLSVVLKDNVAYLTYGEVKLKLDVDDAKQLISLIGMFVDGGISPKLPQVSTEDVLTALSGIKAIAVDNGVDFSVNFLGVLAEIDLVIGENGWNLGGISVSVDNLKVDVTPIDRFADVPQINDADYADITDIVNNYLAPIVSLVKGQSYGVDFDLTIAVDNKNFDVKGNFVYDVLGNIEVNAVISDADRALVNANVVVADGIVYLSVNGLKTAFAIGDANFDLTKIVAMLKGIDENVDAVIEQITFIVGAVNNFDIAKLDFVNIIKEFSYVNDTLHLVVNADVLGLGEFGLDLGVSYGNLKATVSDLKLASVTLGLTATVKAGVANVAVPDTDDHILKFKGEALGAQFKVSADLVNMDVNAEIDYQGQKLYARYVNDRVFVKFGEVKLTSSVKDVAALVKGLLDGKNDKSVFASDSFDVSNISLQTILSGLSFESDGLSPRIVLTLEGVKVSLDLDDKYEFESITVNIAQETVKLEQTDEDVSELSIADDYVEIVPMIEQILNIYDSFKNVLQTGISAKLDTEISLDGTVYALEATIRYNGGLYLQAKIRDVDSLLVKVEMYLADGKLYLDVNGVRLATELPENDGAANGSIDIATVLGALSKAKGYNGILDSVIDAVCAIPAKLDGLDYQRIIKSLTHSNGVIGIAVNAEQLGLADFDLTLGGMRDITLEMNGLSVGSVNVTKFLLTADPVCEQVAAPQETYVTELQIDVMDLTVTARLDLLNKTVEAYTTLFGTRLNVLYSQNRMYLVYGNVKAVLNVADVGKILATVSQLTGMNFDFDFGSINVKDVLNGISFAKAESGYSVGLAIAGIQANVKFDENATFSAATVNAGDVNVNAYPTKGNSFVSIDTSGTFVDLADVLDAFAYDVYALINAKGYSVTLQGTFGFGEHVYDVDADVVYNGGLYVDAKLAYNKHSAVNAEIWFVGNRLYLSVGDLKFVMDMPANSGDGQQTQSLAEQLSAFKGYNSYVDTVIGLVENVLSKFQSGNVDYAAFVDGLTFENGVLALGVDGSQLGLSKFGLDLSSDGVLNAAIDGLSYKDISLNLQATVTACETAIEEPQGDFTTNLSIKIDEKNTVYANIDILNGVYNFRLKDLSVQYSDNIIKLNYKDIYVTGNINEIIDMVKRIDDLVNEFSGADKKDGDGFDITAMLGNVDVKQIVNSLGIASNEEGIVKLSLQALGMPISIDLANGEIGGITIPVDKLNKTFVIKPSEKQSYITFPSESEAEYVSIEKVFDDYFPTIEQLVHTNCWQFVFNDDAIITVDTTMYKLAAGSYFEFYYNKTQKQDFKLRAGITLQKFENNLWKDFISLDVAYIDGEIFVTYNGKLKATLSTASIKECADLLPELERVVPQIKDLIDNMMAAMKEAEGNAATIDFSTILRDMSYKNDIFHMVVNGNVFLSKLGDVAITVSKDGNSMSLDELTLVYDNISVKVSALKVSSSDKVANDDGAVEYACVNHILSYDKANHIDLNSIYELLSAFIKTADMKTVDPETGKEMRSFNIGGTAVVDAVLKKVNIGLFAQVDINEDGKSFVTVKIVRDKISSGLDLSNIAWDDRGGDSYLYFDGVNETVTIIRNSYKTYCSKCKNWCSNGWHTIYQSVKMKNEDYAVRNMTTEQFSAGLMDYILEMVNFSDMIEKQITKPQDNNNEFGIEDIIKAYSYDESNSAFKATADLAPISSALGTLNINIKHDEAYNLTNISGDIGLVSIMNASVSLDLLQPVYGNATKYVTEVQYW